MVGVAGLFGGCFGECCGWYKFEKKKKKTSSKECYCFPVVNFVLAHTVENKIKLEGLFALYILHPFAGLFSIAWVES